MKRYILSLLFAISTMAFAGQDESQNRLDALNASFDKILDSIRDDSTSAQFGLTRLSWTDAQVLAFRFAGYVKKTGVKNDVAIELQDFSYDYGNGQAPTTRIRGAVNYDFSRGLFNDRKIFDDSIEELDQWISSLRHQYFKQYGEALKVEARILQKTRDDSGHYKTASAEVSVSMDLDKLPPEIMPEEEPFLSARFLVSVDYFEGLTLDLELGSNPKYYGFESNRQSLKFYMDRLLNQDADLIKGIEESVKRLKQSLLDLVS